MTRSPIPATRALTLAALALLAACRSRGGEAAASDPPRPEKTIAPDADAAPAVAGVDAAVDVEVVVPGEIGGDGMDEAGDRESDVARPSDAADAADAGPAFAPCGTPPEGMVCIPGGPFLRGSDDGPENERPGAEIVLSTFYIDRFEVTNGAFRECVAAGACRLMKHYRGFEASEQPVVAVDWYNAFAYCAWAGKRLPTEAEWEKAARGTDGRTYPWGEDEADCTRAAVRGCAPERTRPVGSFDAGAWGVHDMAGNAYEFVQDWYAPCYRGCANECGEACDGPDPRGPCDGANACPGHGQRVLRGGSWFWGPDRARTSHRRPMRPDQGGHRLGFRCASGVAR